METNQLVLTSVCFIINDETVPKFKVLCQLMQVILSLQLIISQYSVST